jgi:hypothetical protein
MYFLIISYRTPFRSHADKTSNFVDLLYFEIGQIQSLGSAWVLHAITDLHPMARPAYGMTPRANGSIDGIDTPVS